MNAFSASIEISIRYRTSVMETSPSFSVFRTSMKERELFVFEELLGLACNSVWTYSSVSYSLFIS